MKNSFVVFFTVLFFSFNLMSQQVATFGAGCFWCVEAIFDQLQGVHSVASGYMGGQTLNPTYKDVCSGTTGHAEVIQIQYDQNIISYKELLEVFFSVHDPTTLNRQGNDRGTQYRSAIFFHTAEQQQEAEYYKKQLDDQKIYDRTIVTEISEASKFYKAEDYHQNYYELNKNANPYCSAVITPKYEKFKKVFSSKLKDE